MTAPTLSSAPDLSTPEGRTAYRKELQGVARGVRLVGLAMALSGIAVGASRYFMDPWPAPLRYAALGLAIPGVILMLIGMIQRTRYHLRRLSGR